ATNESGCARGGEVRRHNLQRFRTADGNPIQPELLEGCGGQLLRRRTGSWLIEFAEAVVPDYLNLCVGSVGAQAHDALGPDTGKVRRPHLRRLKRVPAPGKQAELVGVVGGIARRTCENPVRAIRVLQAA